MEATPTYHTDPPTNFPTCAPCVTFAPCPTATTPYITPQTYDICSTSYIYWIITGVILINNITLTLLQNGNAKKSIMLTASMLFINSFIFTFICDKTFYINLLIIVVLVCLYVIILFIKKIRRNREDLIEYEL